MALPDGGETPAAALSGYSGLGLLALILALLFGAVALGFLLQVGRQRARATQALLEADRERRDAEYEIRLTFEHAVIGIAHVAPTGTFIRVNARLCDFLGYSEAELLQRRFEEITHPDDIAPDWVKYRQLQAGDIPAYTMEKRYFHKDGTVVWANLAVTLVRNLDQTPKFAISFIEDITERKHAEAALAESERRHREIFERSPLPMWVVVPTSGRILSANDAAIEQYGYDRERFLGLGLEDIVVEEVLPISGADPGIVQRHRLADGAEVLVEVLIQPIVYEGAAAALMSVNNIEARLAAERALKATEARLTELTSRAPVVLYALDLAGESFAPSYVSENIAAMTGYSVDEALAPDWWTRRLHPDDADRVLASQRSLFETESSSDEYRFRRRDGRYIWVRDERRLIRAEEGTVISLVGSWSDITETHEAMAALMVAKERLERAEELAGLGSWQYDPATETGHWSPQMYRLFGLPPEDGAPSTEAYLDLVHPEDRPHATAVLEAMAAGREVEPQPYRSNPARGPVRHFRPTCQGVRDGAGKLLHYEGTVLDVTARVEREAELRRERERLAYIVEGADLGTWEWNVQTGDLVCNERWAEILGHTLADFEPLHVETWIGFLDPEDLTRMIQCAERHFDGETPYYECEIRVRHKSGEWLWLHDRGKLITRTAGGQPHLMYGTTMDITARKRAEEALRESEARFRTIFESSLSGITVFDAVYGDDGEIADFRFVDASPSIKEHSGFDPEDVLGKGLFEISPELRGTEGAKHMAEVLATGEPAEFEAYDPALDRYMHVVAHRVAEHRVATVFQDITPRRRQEDQIRKLFLAVEQSPASVVITDINGTIEYVNPKFTELTGYRAEEVLGKNPRILKSDETPSDEYEQLWSKITSGETWRGEFKNKRKDGTFYHERAGISPIRNNEGVITHFVAVKEDITAQKELEKQFLQSQRLEAVGRLAGGVAHDFNNMLAVIQGNAELALQHVAEDEPVHKDLTGIISAAERSANLTRQLLAFARQQTTSPRILDLNETLGDMLKMMRRLLGDDLELSWEPGRQLWHCKVDPAQVDQIVANLLVNARDAIEGPGRVTVSTRNEILPPSRAHIHVDATPGEYVVLSVADTGPGISKEEQARIFEPFFTTKGVGEGTGLGLATVYGIARQNNGFVTVSSEPGKGATFEVYLPRELAPAADQDDGADRKPEGGTESVLLVEDEGGILELGVRILERYGYRVTAAANPEEALRKVAEADGNMDLLLTDVVMPGMNGQSLYRNLRERYPGLRVLYMSGYTADVISAKGVLQDGIHFLHKPFSMKTLLNKVREALEGDPPAPE